MTYVLMTAIVWEIWIYAALDGWKRGIILQFFKVKRNRPEAKTTDASRLALIKENLQDSFPRKRTKCFTCSRWPWSQPALHSNLLLHDRMQRMFSSAVYWVLTFKIR